MILRAKDKVKAAAIVGTIAISSCLLYSYFWPKTVKDKLHYVVMSKDNLEPHQIYMQKTGMYETYSDEMASYLNKTMGVRDKYPIELDVVGWDLPTFSRGIIRAQIQNEDSLIAEKEKQALKKSKN